LRSAIAGLTERVTVSGICINPREFIQSYPPRSPCGRPDREQPDVVEDPFRPRHATTLREGLRTQRPDRLRLA
jgi:hypothetical protein